MDITSGPTVEIELAGAVVNIPAATIADLWLAKLRSGEGIAAAPPLSAPRIGEAYDGGLFAGISIENERPVRLVLLPDDQELNWKDAGAWALEQGGVLPSRFDLLVLFKNLKGQFRGQAYWSDTQSAGGESYAWCQYFGDGGQNDYRKDDELRARAVRRLPLE
jgi:hypothetical protein